MKEVLLHAASYDPTTVVVSLVIGGAAIYVGWSLITSNHGISRSKVGYIKVPGLPIFGNIGLLSDVKIFPQRLMELIDSHRAIMNPPILELKMFIRGRLLVSADPNIARECLMKRPKTFRRAVSNVRVVLQDFEGALNDVFFSEGAYWGRMRRLVSPSFSHKNVTSMSDAVGEEIDAMIVRLKTTSTAGPKVIQMNEEAFYFTIRVISAVAFGGLQGDMQEYFFSKQLLSDVNDIFETLFHRFIYPLPHLYWKIRQWMYGPSSGLLADRRLVKFCKQVIVAKKAELSRNAHSVDVSPSQNNGEGGSSTVTAPKTERTSLIESLMRASSANDGTLSDEELLGNVKVFFLAGSDTTSVVITWCVYHLCIDPPLMSAARAEVDSVLKQIGEDGSVKEMTGADILQAVAQNKLPLCKGCFQETLRLKGPAPFVGLTPEGDEPVEVSNGLVIHKGERFMCFFDGCMQDPNVFDDPKSFKPSRWLNPTEEMNKNFLSFGHGPRICPGMNLALSEGIACIAALVRHFDMTLACPPEEIRREQNFVMKANKMPIQISPR